MAENSKLYPVHNEPHYGIYSGVSDDGSMIIGFVGYDSIIVAYFKEDGALRNHTAFPWEMPNISNLNDVSNKSVRAWELEHELTRQHLISIGFARFETVHVNKFWIEGYAIGITQYPSWLQEILDEDEREFDSIDTSPLPIYERVVLKHHTKVDEEQLAELQEDLKMWRESGDFILHHGNDYYCGKDGVIHSS